MTRPWLHVPTPPSVALLPKTAGGMPVVDITQWDTGIEDEIIDTPKGPMITCHCVPGIGRPKIGVQCPTRQRRSMKERRCNVCGVIISPEDELLFIGLYTHPDVPNRVISREGPVHPECARYTALTCTAMLDRLGDVTVSVGTKYRIRDQIAVAVDHNGDVGGRIIPHGQYHGRPTITIGNFRSIYGILSLHIAIPDPATSRLLTFQDWYDIDGKTQ